MELGPDIRNDSGLDSLAVEVAKHEVGRAAIEVQGEEIKPTDDLDLCYLSGFLDY